MWLWCPTQLCTSEHCRHTASLTNHTQVDDEVVESIAAAGRNLEVVVLDGTGVGEAGIVCLLTRASGSLRHVSAIDCSNIGEEARAELTAAAGVGGSSITSLLL